MRSSGSAKSGWPTTTAGSRNSRQTPCLLNNASRRQSVVGCERCRSTCPSPPLRAFYFISTSIFLPSVAVGEDRCAHGRRASLSACGRENHPRCAAVFSRRFGVGAHLRFFPRQPTCVRGSVSNSVSGLSPQTS